MGIFNVEWAYLFIGFTSHRDLNRFDFDFEFHLTLASATHNYWVCVCWFGRFCCCCWNFSSNLIVVLSWLKHVIACLCANWPFRLIRLLCKVNHTQTANKCSLIIYTYIHSDVSMEIGPNLQGAGIFLCVANHTMIDNAFRTFIHIVWMCELPLIVMLYLIRLRNRCASISLIIHFLS